MTTADIEKEKALKSQNTSTPASIYRGGVDTPVKEEKPEPITTADIEKAKAIKPKPNSNLNTQTQDPSRFGKGVDYSGNFDPNSVEEPEEKKGFITNLKDKLSSIKQQQTAKAIENARQPATRYNLAGKTLEDANDLGLAANRAIQNTEIPKWKRATINDVLFNPEYEGIRDSIVSQAINARGANFMKGLAGQEGNYESAIDKYNKEQAQRYSDAIADRDTRAADAQMQDLEAANKRDVGETLQRADTVLGRELDRWGLLYDTETKKQVLDQMVKDSKEFANKVSDPADRLLLTAYQQYLSGDASALDSIISVYGPDILGKIDPIINRFLGGDSDTQTEYPSLTIGNETFTAGEVENLGFKGLNDRIQKLTPEEQDKVISTMEKQYGTTKTINQLRAEYNKRVNNAGLEDAYNKEQIRLTNERADTLTEDIENILNGGYSEENRKKKLTELKNQLDRDTSMGMLGDTEKLKTAKTKLDNAIAQANLAVEVKSINPTLTKNVKLKIDNDGVLDKKSANSTLSYLAGLNWNELINKNTQSVTDRTQKLNAVKGTQGYKDVVNFLTNPNVQAYAYGEGKNNYKYAVDKFLAAFGGEPKDYGFLNITW
jgi:hypothetical protein